MLDWHPWRGSALDVRVERLEYFQTEYQSVSRLFNVSTMEFQSAVGLGTQGRYRFALSAYERLLKRKLRPVALPSLLN